MKYIQCILLYSILLTSIYGQDEITVYKLKADIKIYTIETDILNSIKLLHTRKTGKEILFKYVYFNSFDQVLNKITQEKNPNVLAISGITITKKRQKHMSFSKPYIFTTNCILALKDRSDTILWNKVPRIGFTKGDLSEVNTLKLADTYTIKSISYRNVIKRVEALVKGDVDYIVAENIDLLEYPNLKIIKVLENDYGGGLGIAYPKGSNLKEMFDPYIHYLIRSRSFRALMLKSYGKSYMDYYKEKLTD